uniref:CFI-box-CTERM domain-containing protein n=1 Tax=Paracoccus sp. T5 TaxID=3402161 RepID=UPI003AEEA57A
MSKSPKDTKGPTVKTGPTKGQNRSRNDDGRWRAKRSDAGKSRPVKDNSGSGKKGCFLTTTACKLRGLRDDCHELRMLRRFRDDVLVRSREGRALVEEYYREAPRLAHLVEVNGERNHIWREIQVTVEHIERGNNLAAIAAYRGMFQRLRDMVD